MSLTSAYFVRKLNLSRILLTRTDWSYNRKRLNFPKCHLPRYLLDGSFKKGHKKSGRNESGHITTRHKVGPGRKNVRLVDFMRVPYTENSVEKNSLKNNIKNDINIDANNDLNNDFNNNLNNVDKNCVHIDKKTDKENCKNISNIDYDITLNNNIDINGDNIKKYIDDKNIGKIYRDQVVAITYDPCRSAMLAKIIGDSSDCYKLILAATGMKVGDIILKSRHSPPHLYEFKPGDTFPLKYFNMDAKVFNIENRPGNGGRIARCGDGYMSVAEKYDYKGKNYVILERKGRLVELEGDCLASYGSAMSNGLRELPLGKAGRARRYGMGRGGKTGILRLRNHRRQRGRKNLLTMKKRN